MLDYFFITEDNIVKEIEKLEEDAKDFAKEDTTPASSTLEVTEMSQKKLTIQIKPKKKKATFMVGDDPIDIEDESDTEETPSSAEIKVIHEKSLPNLHGILKQRSVSESSDDYSFNGSCSPGSPRDDVLNGLRKSVSFNEKIDSTTYKPGTSVTTMTQTLKNKRRRNRRREEKRKRHNSGGSEGSSGDDHDHRYASDSHSEGNESDHTCDDKSGEKLKGNKKEKTKHPRKRKSKNNKNDTKEDSDSVLDDLIEEDDIPCPELEDIPNNENDVKASSIQNDLEEPCPDLEEIPDADLICEMNDKDDGNPDTEKIASVTENGKMSVNEENLLSEKVKKKLNISSLKTNDKCDSDDDVVCEGDDDKDNLRTKVSDLGDWEKVKMSQKESDERTSDDKENSKIIDSSQNGSNSGNNEKKINDVISSGKSMEERVNGAGDDSGVECGSDTPHTEEESTKAANLNNKQGDSTDLNWSTDNVGSQDHRTQCAFSFSNSVVYDLDVD